jgi:hypothetical protein
MSAMYSPGNSSSRFNPEHRLEPDFQFEQEILNRAAYESTALDDTAFETPDLNRLLLLLHLIPVFGLVPSVWTLTRQTHNRQQRSTSRLAITLAAIWALGYATLNFGAGGGDTELNSLGSSLMLFNTLLTSGYFVGSVVLMLRVWQKQPLQVPGLSNIAKHLP